MQRLVGLVRRCVDDYHMIADGETVAVGISGGKDSLMLLTLLHALSLYHPAKFRLEAFTVDMGLPGMDFTPAAAYCDTLGVPYHTVKTDIAAVVFDYRKEQNPCSMCSKMRRGALNNAVTAAGIHTLALGHHYDDAVETFLMSLVYEGRLSCFEPVTELDRTGVKQIRPMLYIGEKAIASAAQKLSLPIVQSTCPADKNTKREEIKQLIAALSHTYPDLKTKIFGAMQRFPLPQWGVEDLRRRPLPEEPE